MNEGEIVITGMGLLTPLGKGVEENWRNVRAKKTGIGYFPHEKHPQRLCYMGKIAKVPLPDDIPQGFLNQMKFLNRGALLGFVAAHEAATQAMMNLSDIPPERKALYLGTGDLTRVGYDFMFPAMEKGTDGGFKEIHPRLLNTACLNEVNPFFLLESLHNNLFSFLSARFELKGPNACLAGLSPCGLHAVELACRGIRRREVEQALVVGCGNWITEVPLYEMDGLGWLSRCRHGIHSFRPFDQQRDGFIPGEGGAALFLEAAEIAEKRGIPIYGKVRGTGNCMEFSSQGGLGVPPEAGKRCMEMALKEGSSDIHDLAFIIPHGSATPKGDGSELGAIQSVLGRHVSKIPLCGLKPYTGHLAAASDIAEVIIGIKALEDGVVPATPNFHKADEPFSQLRISDSHLSCNQSQFLTLSYGMGGQSSSVLLEV